MVQERGEVLQNYDRSEGYLIHDLFEGQKEVIYTSYSPRILAPCSGLGA